MKKFVLAFAATISICSCGSKETTPFDANDQMTFAMSTKSGYTQDFISRLELKDSGWAVEHRKDDGTWQDVTCEDKCKLFESSPAQIENLRQRAKIPYKSFKCLQDSAFALCKTKFGGKNLYFLIGDLESNQVKVGVIQALDPNTLKPREP